MDYRKFGTFIIIVGVCLVLFGGIKYIKEEVTPPKPVVSFMPTIKAKASHDNSLKLLALGTIIGCIGVGIYASSKSTDKNE